MYKPKLAAISKFAVDTTELCLGEGRKWRVGACDKVMIIQLDNLII